jgi:hypothetical protein
LRTAAMARRAPFFEVTLCTAEAGLDTVLARLTEMSTPPVAPSRMSTAWLLTMPGGHTHVSEAWPQKTCTMWDFQEADKPAVASSCCAANGPLLPRLKSHQIQGFPLWGPHCRTAAHSGATTALTAVLVRVLGVQVALLRAENVAVQVLAHKAGGSEMWQRCKGLRCCSTPQLLRSAAHTLLRQQHSDIRHHAPVPGLLRPAVSPVTSSKSYQGDSDIQTTACCVLHG